MSRYVPLESQDIFNTYSPLQLASHSEHTVQMRRVLTFPHTQAMPAGLARQGMSPALRSFLLPTLKYFLTVTADPIFSR